MKDIFRKLHLWVSIPFGLVITITCFTGALLVFEGDIVSLLNSDMMTVEPAGKPLPVDSLLASVEPLLDEGVTVTGVEASSEPDEAYKVNLSKPHRAAVYVDQYTGKVKGCYERPAFFDVTRRLHRWLMDAAPKDGGIYWGKVIVGASTLAFVVILLTGIVIWWPRSRKMLRNRVQIAVNKGKNRFLYDLHVAGGFYAVLFLLAMAMTGLTWSFEWYNKAFYGAMGVEVKPADAKNGSAETRTAVPGKGGRQVATATKRECLGDCSQCDGVPCGKNPTPVTDASSGATVQADASSGATVLAADDNADCDVWQVALDAVLAKSGEYSSVTVSDGVVTANLGGWGNQRASDRYIFDRSTGKITSIERYADSPLSTRASGWVRTIHVGAWGGWLSKIICFLAALLGAAFPLTGYYFWIRRLYLKKKK